MRLALVMILAASCHTRLRPPTLVVEELPEELRPSPDPKRWGPLSTAGKPPETPWSSRTPALDRNREVHLSRAAIRAETDALEALLRQRFVESTTEATEALKYARDTAAILERIAPYSIDAITDAVRSVGGGAGLFAPGAGLAFPWHHEFKGRAGATAIPWELKRSPSGIAQLTISYFADASSPAWAQLDVAALARAPGIVLDLRGAWG